MDDEMYRERIRSLKEHTDKLVAQSDALKAQADKSNALILELNHQLVERDAEIAALRQQVAEAERQWDNVRYDNAKLLRQLTENRHAYKRLHDDMEDVNRHNAELRQQVAELQAWKDAVPVKAILWYFDVSEFSQAIVNTNTVMQIDYNTALDKWHRDMVEEVIDV